MKTEGLGAPDNRPGWLWLSNGTAKIVCETNHSRKTPEQREKHRHAKATARRNARHSGVHEVGAASWMRF